MLAHDPNGFLNGGTPLVLDTRVMAEALELWRAIREDTRAMRQMLGRSGASARPKPTEQTQPQPSPANPNTTVTPQRPAANDSGYSEARKTQERAGTPQRPARPSESSPPESPRRASEPQRQSANPSRAASDRAAATPSRDDRGRFTGGDSSSSSSQLLAERRASERLGQDIADSVKDSLGQVAQGAERIDPIFGALKETSDLVKPLAKPLGMAVGALSKYREQRQEKRLQKAAAQEQAKEQYARDLPWYRRIWQQLRDNGNKDSGGSKMLGALMGLLGPLLGRLGLPFGRNSSGPDTDTRSSHRDRGGRRGQRSGGGMLRGAGKLLRRVPLVGSLVAGASGLASLFGLGGEQTTEERFKGAGSGLGGLLGGVVGALGGLLGSMAGATIGSVVGEKVGGWLSTLDWTEVGNRISNQWGAFTQWAETNFGGVFTRMGETWDSLVELGSKAFSGLGELYDSAKNWLGDKLGFVSDAASSGISWITSGVKRVTSAVVEGAKNLGGKAAETAVQAKDAVVSGASAAGSYVAEKASQTKEATAVYGGRLLGSLNKGYRHRERFDGIKGGSALAKYGTYTNDEADRIRELKQGGFNTSANLAGGMPAEIRDKIIAASQEAGLDPNTMLSMAAMESGGNANAISSTGAIGVYQFVGKTASGVGITNRFDADQNIAGAMKLTQQNKASLEKSKLPVTPENLYMMHQLGPSAAKEIIRGAASGKSISQLSEGARNAVNLNYGKGSKTAAEYLNKNRQALDARFSKVVGTGSSASVAATAQPNSSATPNPATPPATYSATPATPSAMPSSAATATRTSAAPSPEQMTPPSTPSMPTPLASNGRSNGAPTEVVVAQPLTQNLSDRGIAHLVTGGIGSTRGGLWPV